MDRLKSIFISLAISTWTYFHLYIYQEIMEPTSSITLAGLLLVATVPLSFFIILLTLKPVARTTKSLPFLAGLIAIGSLLLVYISTQNGKYYYAYIGFISMVLWLIYIIWYSVMPQKESTIKKGEPLPELSFINEEENLINISDFINKKLLLLFYRGNWCPLCMAQIKEISSQYNELSEREVEVLLISPQPQSHSLNLAKKMGVKFHFLTDAKNAMASKLKIDHPHGTPLGMEVFGYTSETVLPTVIITDKEKKILLLDQTDNYRLRPEPSSFLAALDKLEA